MYIWGAEPLFAISMRLCEQNRSLSTGGRNATNMELIWLGCLFMAQRVGDCDAAICLVLA
jgi:hypothetical protein